MRIQGLMSILFLFALFPLANLLEQAREGQTPDSIVSCIEKIVMFTEWPKSHSSGQLSDHFCIVVVGQNVVSAKLQNEVQSKTISGKPVKFTSVSLDDLRLMSKKEITANHIIFISLTDKTEVAEVLSLVAGTAVLTMSNASGLGELGVMVNFYDSGTKMPFEINHQAVKKSGIYIDALLLNNVRIVTPNN